MMARKIMLGLLMLAIMILPGMVFAAEQPAQSQVEVLTLDQCLDLALEKSQKIKEADKKVEKAKAELRAAAGALWPSLDYMLGYSKLSDPVVLGSKPKVVNGIPDFNNWETIEGEDYGYAGSISLTQPLYTGGKLSGALKLAKLQLEIAKEDQRKTKQTLIYDVKSAYYKVWLAEQMAVVAQTSYDNMGHHYQQIKNFYKVGTASKFDLLQAQVQWEGKKPTVIKAQNGLALAKLNLITILGIDKNRQFDVTCDLDKLQLPEDIAQQYQQVLEVAYKYRSEIHQVEIGIEVSKVKAHMEKAGYKPNVALTGSYDRKGTDLSMDDDKTWKLTLGIEGNLFDGFTTLNKVSAAKDDIDLAKIKETSTHDLIRLDVEQSLQGLKESLETTKANQSNIDLAKEALRLTQARFDAGMATTMDIMDSQLALDHALNGYYEGVSSYLTALAKMDLAMGKDQ